uniref:Uncharacterized protein n=1 Tax=Fagus sylvatica TaxID=28930 RepID=A0A2N9HXD8_FAGSY
MNKKKKKVAALVLERNRTAKENKERGPARPAGQQAQQASSSPQGQQQAQQASSKPSRRIACSPLPSALHRIVTPLMSSRDRLGMGFTPAAPQQIKAPFWSPKRSVLSFFFLDSSRWNKKNQQKTPLF